MMILISSIHTSFPGVTISLHGNMSHMMFRIPKHKMQANHKPSLRIFRTVVWLFPIFCFNNVGLQLLSSRILIHLYVYPMRPNFYLQKRIWLPGQEVYSIYYLMESHPLKSQKL